jgi:hypothetical protein
MLCGTRKRRVDDKFPGIYGIDTFFNGTKEEEDKGQERWDLKTNSNVLSRRDGGGIVWP